MNGVVKWKGLCLGVVALVLLHAGPARAQLINGGFETGDFTGWTIFTDPNGVVFGSVGDPPRVTLFDTAGTGTPSLSAHFNVGRQGFPVDLAGGGIFQNVTLGAGDLTISVNIAVQSPSNNAAGGLFELLFDGVVVDSQDFGPVNVNTITRDTLTANIPVVSAGQHEIRLRVRRIFGSGGEFSTPNQFIDNVSLSGTAVSPAVVPEPTSLALAGLGVAALVLRGRRWRRAAG